MELKSAAKAIKWWYQENEIDEYYKFEQYQDWNRAAINVRSVQRWRTIQLNERPTNEPIKKLKLSKRNKFELIIIFEEKKESLKLMSSNFQ